MRRALVLVLLLAASSPAVAKMDGAQWKDTETKFRALFANPGMTDDKMPLVKQIADDAEPRSFTLVADGLVLEAGHVGRIAENLATQLAELKKYLGKKDDKWYPGDEAKMAEAQQQVGTLERQKADEQRVLKALVAAGTAGSEAMRKTILAKCNGSKDWSIRAEGAKLAGSVPDEVGSQAMLQASLEKETDARVRIAALDALETAPGTAWHHWVVARLADAEWGVQMVAARIAGKRTIGKAIPDLITALAKAAPRVAEEINGSLKKLTQQNFEPFAEVWAKWWADNRSKFGEDGKPLEPLAVGGVRPSDAAFYGIKVNSDKVVFVIDISGSMKEEKKAPENKGPTVTGDGPAPVAALSGPKIEIAKSILKHAIEGLDKNAHFNIIAFNHSVTQWKDKMTLANPAGKEDAYAWIRDFPPKGSTYVDGALRMAFKLAGLGAFDKEYAPGVDTIFVLSDGAPTDNSFPNSVLMPPDEILGHVREWNLQKRVIINCVGIDNVVVGIQFLKDLAAQNGGTYRDG